MLTYVLSIHRYMSAPVKQTNANMYTKRYEYYASYCFVFLSDTQYIIQAFEKITIILIGIYNKKKHWMCFFF